MTTVLMLAASFRPADDVAPSMRLAVRTGFITFTATLAVGAAMIAIGMVAARTQSQEAAYSAASALKNGHAALMHGIFVLPALAWLLSLLDWSPALRSRWVAMACAAYAAAAGAVVVASIAAL